MKFFFIFLFLFTFTSSSPSSSFTSSLPLPLSLSMHGITTQHPSPPLTHEVHGSIQGVFFRKCTQEKASSLGLVGWVRNTDKGTVQGVAQGDKAALDLLRKWLSTEGSPQSKITKCEITEEKTADKVEHKSFEVKRDK